MNRIIRVLALLVLLLLLPMQSQAAPPAAVEFRGGVLLPSASRNADTTTDWYYAGDNAGLFFTVNTTVHSGATTVTITVEGWDEAVDAPYTQTTFLTTLITQGRIRIGHWAGGTTGANSGLTETKMAPLPQIFRLKFDHDIATAVTYSVYGFPVK